MRLTGERSYGARVADRPRYGADADEDTPPPHLLSERRCGYDRG